MRNLESEKRFARSKNIPNDFVKYTIQIHSHELFLSVKFREILGRIAQSLSLVYVSLKIENSFNFFYVSETSGVTLIKIHFTERINCEVNSG